MAEKSTKACEGRIKKDKNFGQKLESCKDENEKDKLLRSEGFVFTPLELKKIDTELEEDDLDKISGGVGDASHVMRCCKVGPADYQRAPTPLREDRPPAGSPMGPSIRIGDK